MGNEINHNAEGVKTNLIASCTPTTITSDFALLIPSHLIRPKTNLNCTVWITWIMINPGLQSNPLLQLYKTLCTNHTVPIHCCVKSCSLKELLKGGFILVITGRSDKYWIKRNFKLTTYFHASCFFYCFFFMFFLVAVQAIFTSEKVQDIIPYAANGVLILGQGMKLHPLHLSSLPSGWRILSFPHPAFSWVGAW